MVYIEGPKRCIHKARDGVYRKGRRGNLQGSYRRGRRVYTQG